MCQILKFTIQNSIVGKRDRRCLKAPSVASSPQTSSNRQTMNPNQANTEASQISNLYIGMWVTKDGYIRHELLPNNRYDEARGDRRKPPHLPN
jgi:hypothetical protein